MNAYADWCREHGCEHGHCSGPDCEHPQPFEHDGVLYCGRCWFIDGVLTEMAACTPETCE